MEWQYMNITATLTTAALFAVSTPFKTRLCRRRNVLGRNVREQITVVLHCTNNDREIFVNSAVMCGNK
jgi:hypothetical protein